MRSGSGSARALSALATAVALAVLATAAGAEDQYIYQYKDRDGRTVYADTPPLGNIPWRRLLKSGVDTTATTSAEQRSAADRELDARKRRADQAEQQAKADKDTANKEARKENCDNARRQLAALDSGQRIARYNDQGEREFLDDAQRAQETERARKAVAEWCGGT